MRSRIMVPVALIMLVLITSGCTDTEEPAGSGPNATAPVVQDQTTEAELNFIGFSGLEIDSDQTDFSDGKLSLSIRNSNPDRIIIKKVTATYLDDIIENITNSGLISLGRSFTYTFDFSRTIKEEGFWIYADVLYDIPGRSMTNQRSDGSVIGGLDTDQISQCMDASIEVGFYNFYVGTRILNVRLENTGNKDLLINALYGDSSGELVEAAEPFELASGEFKTVGLEGLIRLMESVIFVSEECPGAQEVILVEDIAGV